MTCLAQYATSNEFQDQWFFDFEADTETELNAPLQNASAEINMALRASGQCNSNCTFDTDALAFLRALTTYIAALQLNAICVRLSDEQRRIMDVRVTDYLRQIRMNELELCAGHTAKQYPAFGRAALGLTAHSKAVIIRDRIVKENV